MALVLSSFSAGAWLVALVWQQVTIGGGPRSLSLVTAAGAVGVVLSALLGGVAADRFPQKRILCAVAVAEVITISTVAVLSLTDLLGLRQLVVASFIAGGAMGFYYPAYSAWLPALVPTSDLQAVNGFEGAVRPVVGQALGPAAAGLAVSSASPAAAFGLAAVAALAGLVALTLVPVTPTRHAAIRGRPSQGFGDAFRDILEGGAYLRKTPWLLTTLALASVVVLALLGPFEVLTPYLVKDRLNGDARQYAIVMAAFGLGGAAGSLGMAITTIPRRYMTTMTLMWGLSTVPFVVMSLAVALWQMVVAAAVLGILWSAPMVIWGTLLQVRVPPHLLGRVSSLDFFVSISLMPVSMALAGPVSEVVGIAPTYLAAALITILAVFIVTLLGVLRREESSYQLVLNMDEGQPSDLLKPVERRGRNAYDGRSNVDPDSVTNATERERDD